MSPLCVCGLLGVVAFISGCGHRPTVGASGARSFTIQPSRRTEGDAVETTEFTIRVPAPAWVWVSSNAGTARVRFAPTHGESEVEGIIRVTRSKVWSQPNKATEFRFCTEIKLNGSGSISEGLQDVSGKDLPKQHVLVPSLRGPHLMEVPLKIAELDGTPVTLVVKAKSPQPSGRP